MELVNSYFGQLAQLSATFQAEPKILIGGLVLVCLLLYGLSLGRTKALISLLAIYIAYVLQAMFPYFSELHKAVRYSPEMYMTRIALFLIFYIIVFAILNRSLVKQRLTMKEFSFFWVLFISILQLGILVSTILNFIPPDKLAAFPKSILTYFAEQRALFFWLAFPVLILIMMRKEKTRRTSISVN